MKKRVFIIAAALSAFILFAAKAKRRIKYI